MIDPFGVVQGLGYAIRCLYDQIAKTKHNREECILLKEHVGSIYEAISIADQLSSSMEAQLERLRRALVDVSSILEDASKRPAVQRFLWAQDISNSIHAVYQEVERTIVVFNMVGYIDIHALQKKSDMSRERECKQILQKLEENDANVLELFGLQNARMNQVMDTIHALRKSVDNIEGTLRSENRLYRRGLRALQRHFNIERISDSDAFKLTHAEVRIHWSSKLGSGGFGDVYKGAWHGSAVAVKVLNPAVSEELVSREVELWKSLRHPNILQFYGVAPMASPPFLVCALMTGDIMRYISMHQDVDRCKLLHDAACGLQYLHFHNVIHRDLKGTNILVDEWGKACLSDFGMAGIKTYTISLSSIARPATLFGSLQWMAPEQIIESKASRKTDIYSFGMTIYEVYVGKPPFADIPMEALYTLVVSKRLKLPNRPDSSCPAIIGDDIWQLMREAWSSCPDERPGMDHIVRTLAVSPDVETRRPRPPRDPYLYSRRRARLEVSGRSNTKPAQPNRKVLPPSNPHVRRGHVQGHAEALLLDSNYCNTIIDLFRRYVEDDAEFAEIIERIGVLRPPQPNILFERFSLVIAVSYWISRHHFESHTSGLVVIPPLISGRINKRMLVAEKRASPLLLEYYKACGDTEPPRHVLVLGDQWAIDRMDRAWRFVQFDLAAGKVTIYQPVCNCLASKGTKSRIRSNKDGHLSQIPRTPVSILLWISLFRDCGWEFTERHSGNDKRKKHVQVQHAPVQHVNGICPENISSCLWDMYLRLLGDPP